VRKTRLLCIVAVALTITAGPGIAQSACLLPAKLCGELSAGPLRQQVADFHGVTNDKTRSGMFVAKGFRDIMDIHQMSADSACRKADLAGFKTAMTMGKRKKARTLYMSGGRKCAWVKG